MIAHRYLFREVSQVFVAMMAVLLLIYVSNRFVRYLAQAASGYISGDLISELVLLKLAENLAILMPLALYLSVLLAMGRLYQDSEIIAFSAGGLGVPRLARGLMWFAAGFSVIAGVLSLYVSPRAADLQRALFEQAKGEVHVAGIRPGAFREFSEGDRVVYVESVAPDGKSVGNVFVRVKRKRGQDLLLAERAFPAVEGPEGDRFIVLENGRRYTGKAGRMDFVVTHFERHAVRLEQAGGSTGDQLDAMSTLALLREGGPQHLAALQWRLSVPVSVLVLVLMAVSLARASPRQGRYAKLVTAFILYFVYNNAVGIAQKLVEREELPAAVGVWPVHLVFAALGLGMLAQQTSLGWRAPWRRRSRASVAP